MDSAQIGRKILESRLQSVILPEKLYIKKIHLGKNEDSVFYRVIYGNFASKDKANAFAERLQPKTDYAKSIPSWHQPEAPDEPTLKNTPNNTSTRYNSAAIAAKYASMQM